MLCLDYVYPEKQLFDWGMMRMFRPSYGVGDTFAADSANLLKKKRDAERLTKLEEEEKNRVETRNSKYFAEILNGIRELQLQVQTSQKRRKQRSDGVQCLMYLYYYPDIWFDYATWHAKSGSVDSAIKIYQRS